MSLTPGIVPLWQSSPPASLCETLKTMSQGLINNLENKTLIWVPLLYCLEGRIGGRWSFKSIHFCCAEGTV